MRVTVCELASAAADSPMWAALADRLEGERTDLLLLPEMPFSPWLASSPEFAPKRWRAAVTAHEEGLRRLPYLGVPAVISTRPVERAGERYNEAFLWTARHGYRGLHLKSRLPTEPDFWESTWFSAGPEPGPVGAAHGSAVIAAAICSELWVFERARAAGRAGAHLLVTPRATTAGWNELWLVAGRAAALSAGAFCLSSNLVSDQGVGFGGRGWIIDPDGGVVARTNRAEPLVTCDLDLRLAEQARSTYPRNLVGPAGARPVDARATG